MSDISIEKVENSVERQVGVLQSYKHDNFLPYGPLSFFVIWS